MNLCCSKRLGPNGPNGPNGPKYSLCPNDLPISTNYDLFHPIYTIERPFLDTDNNYQFVTIDINEPTYNYYYPSLSTIFKYFYKKIFS